MRAHLLLGALAGLAAIASPCAAADGDAPTEYEVKAAFLYNFARYVEWPPSASPEPTPFVITVLGDDPFGPLLDAVLAGKTVEGRPIQLRRATRPGRLEPSDVVFISDSEAGRLPDVLEDLEGTPVLTVGEMERFAERGGVIRFRKDRNRIRLDINVAAAERSGLRISSELLKLARIVGRRAGG